MVMKLHEMTQLTNVLYYLSLIIKMSSVILGTTVTDEKSAGEEVIAW